MDEETTEQTPDQEESETEVTGTPDEGETEVSGTPEEPVEPETPAEEQAEPAGLSDDDLAAQSAQVEADAAAAQAAEEQAQAQMPAAPTEEQPVSQEELQQQAEAQASIPRMPDGTPIPEMGTVTADQLANNPSDVQNAPAPNPSVAQDIQDTAASIAATENPSDVPAPAEESVPNPSNAVQQPEPMVEQPEPTPADNRQTWLCVSTEGPRTDCPPFKSDSHLVGQPVVCPTCGSQSVRRPLPTDGAV